MAPARVLLVDDDLLFIRRMQRANDGAIDLQVATTKRDALSRTADWTPDVVVIDSLLDDADSFGLIDLLRESSGGSGVGVICLAKGAGVATGYQTEGNGFFGVVRRDAGTDGVYDALRCALSVDQASAKPFR